MTDNIKHFTVPSISGQNTLLKQSPQGHVHSLEMLLYSVIFWAIPGDDDKICRGCPDSNVCSKMALTLSYLLFDTYCWHVHSVFPSFQKGEPKFWKFQKGEGTWKKIWGGRNQKGEERFSKWKGGTKLFK